ncbi:hypothetical protein QLL95_gp0595 [Cotonvirus japonicus]|uniref:Uncharacterized protein n=1 Tax=Cotonvirus japonicus TaxID=2811091 RepID=A0ABM7NTM1_9VIRU|nr:hypothetical protein QLL95_gp0595 [Cotonvirus japonicus]BCS83528.1 hypothetical protein [Cotonvirus japonicus]
MSHVIQLPAFSYLDKPYLGDYFYVDKRIVLKFNNEPQQEFDTFEKITEIYSKINQLLNIDYLELTYFSTIMSVKINNINTLLKIPTQTLCINDNRTNNKTFLQPKIINVTAKKYNDIVCLTINLDFREFLLCICDYNMENILL